MSGRFSMLALVLLLSYQSPLFGAEAGKANPEATAMAAELIGAPVFAKDGIEVGEVTDIAFDDKLEPLHLRMAAAAALGLGTRTVEVPKDAFMALRGAVVLDISSEEVASLPEVKSPSPAR